MLEGFRLKAANGRSLEVVMEVGGVKKEKKSSYGGFRAVIIPSNKTSMIFRRQLLPAPP